MHRGEINLADMMGSVENSYWKDFVAGKEYAFKMLYDCYVDRLFTFGRRYSDDKDLIKDIVHDLFVDLHHYRGRLNPDVNVSAYLFSSLRRKVMAAIQQQKRLNAHIQQHPDIGFLVEWDIERETIRDEVDTRLLLRIAQEVSKLPARQQEALYLRFSSEFTYEQIGDIMGVSVASCRTLVYRALKQLRKKIENTPMSHLLYMLFR